MTKAKSPWLTLEEVLRATEGRLVFPVPSAEANVAFSACSIDSRSLAEGELFVPLPGTRADGHDFVAAVLEGAAGGTLVSEERPPDAGWARSRKPVVSVRDPLRALQALGRHCRAKSGIPVTA
ncbi:MAG TPA: Mur ligase domain-containing protein, partial [Candidatus Limnocylindrales bacterium]|nr:Mur ligase domain-containing protein [Candidatus Limnocylindrales bacterium]